MSCVAQIVILILLAVLASKLYASPRLPITSNQESMWAWVQFLGEAQGAMAVLLGWSVAPSSSHPVAVRRRGTTSWASIVPGDPRRTPRRVPWRRARVAQSLILAASSSSPQRQLRSLSAIFSPSTSFCHHQSEETHHSGGHPHLNHHHFCSSSTASNAGHSAAFRPNRSFSSLSSQARSMSQGPVATSSCHPSDVQHQGFTLASETQEKCYADCISKVIVR
ncbi:uncharacterized protein LOC135200608 [Macrobrachium nipponense]|uniref:uncharacterized protein LOC135200608 n=1 Tax=Macrobrachium nipponense TaxID=159736 RepID=UPI0030C8891D